MMSCPADLGFYGQVVWHLPSLVTTASLNSASLHKHVLYMFSFLWVCANSSFILFFYGSKRVRTLSRIFRKFRQVWSRWLRRAAKEKVERWRVKSSSSTGRSCHMQIQVQSSVTKKTRLGTRKLFSLCQRLVINAALIRHAKKRTTTQEDENFSMWFRLKAIWRACVFVLHMEIYSTSIKENMKYIQTSVDMCIVSLHIYELKQAYLHS